MRPVLTLLLMFMPVVPFSAYALTLEITGGSASGNSVATTCPEPGVDVSGANFTLTGFSGTTFCGRTMVFDGSLTLNGLSYPGACTPSCVYNSMFTFTDVFTEPTPLALFAYHGPYSGSFTMSGHSDLAGGVDFVGHGTTTLGWIFTDDSHTAGFIFQRWDFAVPEPSSLALLVFALSIGTAVMTRTRARRSAEVRSGRSLDHLVPRARSEGGIVRPSALAVLRLMTSSNVVGCSTEGRQAWRL